MTKMTFRKSSRSATNGACVQVAAPFRRSARCEAQNCIEVATPSVGDVLVRDSKDTESPILGFSRGAWMDFTGAVSRGELAP